MFCERQLARELVSEPMEAAPDFEAHVSLFLGSPASGKVVRGVRTLDGFQPSYLWV